MSSSEDKRVECPICQGTFSEKNINSHVNDCLTKSEPIEDKSSKSNNQEGFNPLKRKRTEDDSSNTEIRENSASKKASPWGSLQKSPSQFPTKQHRSPPKTNGKGFFAKQASTVSSSSKSGPSNRSELSSSISKPATIESKVEKLKDIPNSSSVTLDSRIPIAEQLRPKLLEDYIGQQQAIGSKTMLRTLIESHQVPSIIIWGPPGSGKTTLARIVAEKCKETKNMRFVQISATTSGIADVKEVIKVAKNEIRLCKRQTILFIDEIHRFNKLQQDTFLPHIEDGTITLIGATTENPSFQVNNALLSRCKVIVLEKHSAENIVSILRRAVYILEVKEIDDENNNAKRKNETIVDNEVAINTSALSRLAFMSDGDARIALNSFQTIVNTARHSTSKLITSDLVMKSLERTHVQYDRAGEEHYNCASALQKSIRGSSEDGAIYWLARMLEGGEDPLFIARRFVVIASEDVGLADPAALLLATSTHQACHVIGMPECAINLAHCCTYLARAPKSNESYKALADARQMIKNHQGPLPGVPMHLRNASTGLMKKLGYGQGYKYSHNYTKEEGRQDYLPEELKGHSFFQKK